MSEYGLENFKVELIEIVPYQLKDKVEQYYIQYYDSYNNGYNVTIGGDYNPMFDENVKRKHRKIMQSSELRQKMSKSVREAYTPELKEWFGKHSRQIWENWDEKSRQNCIRGFIKYNESRKISIGIIDENNQIIKRFECCADACTYCNVERKRAGEILRKCDKYNKNGSRCKMFGYYWTRL